MVAHVCILWILFLHLLSKREYVLPDDASHYPILLHLVHVKRLGLELFQEFLLLIELFWTEVEAPFLSILHSFIFFIILLFQRSRFYVTLIDLGCIVLVVGDGNHL